MKITGLESLVNRLNLMGGNARYSVARGMQKAVTLVQGDAKRLCPVDTGRLRASISTKVESEGFDVVGTIGTNVEYASYVEFGTGQRGDPSVAHRRDWKGQAPQPFLFPALKMNEKTAADVIKTELIHSIAGRGGE